jgi:uncharacterized protein YecE (DUF72 family)
MAARGHIRLGTCSWTAKGWAGKFYPSGTDRSDFIAEYAKVYDTVEIDATFYGTPHHSTLEGWYEKTPEGFQFAAKAPQAITHEKFLEDCGRELAEYLDAMSLLKEKLGPILFQFPYYSKKKGVTFDDFVVRLKPFLKTLPEDGFRFAEHSVATTLIDHPWMAPPGDLIKRDGVVTADFAYIRWLGDRYAIEKITKTWNERVVDRDDDLGKWIAPINNLLDGNVDVYGFVNNHYSGYAPADIDQLMAQFPGP